MKLHRATLLDGVIIQFKDEATMSYSGKCSFDDKMAADDGAASRGVYAASWTDFPDGTAAGPDVKVLSLFPKW